MVVATAFATIFRVMSASNPQNETAREAPAPFAIVNQ
jgi:hypothetical protein